MADLDLTATTDVAARAWYESIAVEDHTPRPWGDLSDAERFRWREMVLPALTAAAPVIAEQVREGIARRIEALVPDPHTEHESCGDCWTVRQAAKIAREVPGE